MPSPADALATAVQETFGFNPFTGAVFLFRETCGTTGFKVLAWDRTGVLLVNNRLEGGQSVWPQVRE